VRLSTTAEPAPEPTPGPTTEPTPEPNPEPTPSDQITLPPMPAATLPSYDYTTFDPDIGEIDKLRVHSFELIIKTASGRSMKTFDSEVIHHELVNTVFLIRPVRIVRILHNHGRLYPRRKKSVKPLTVPFAQESLLSPVIGNIT